MAGKGFAYAPGEMVDLDAETERRLIESGQAEAVRPKPVNIPKKPTRKSSVGKVR